MSGELEAPKLGRPSAYTEALADEIVADISKGVTLADICRRDHMPDRSTVYAWKRNDDAFSQRIERAREEGFDAIAEDCFAIAEAGSNDYVVKKRPDGSEYDAFDSEHVQRSKLRIETRLKLLAKWDPKRYGDKIDLNHGGSLTVEIQRFSED